MTTTKTLMLAGLAALCLGAGGAMAQSEVPSDPGNAYWTSGRQAVAPRTAESHTMNQTTYGASPVITLHSTTSRGVAVDNAYIDRGGAG